MQRSNTDEVKKPSLNNASGSLNQKLASINDSLRDIEFKFRKKRKTEKLDSSKFVLAKKTEEEESKEKSE